MLFIFLFKDEWVENMWVLMVYINCLTAKMQDNSEAHWLCIAQISLKVGGSLTCENQFLITCNSVSLVDTKLLTSSPKIDTWNLSED